MNVSEGPLDTGGLLVEEDREGRLLEAGLFDVVVVVETDAEELAGHLDRCFQGHVGKSQGLAACIGGLGQAVFTQLE